MNLVTLIVLFLVLVVFLVIIARYYLLYRKGLKGG
ncbi:putative membrane protein [Methanobacterium formicicum]|jgi:hypothetical protein|uniref:Putative membrane protein n=1 Tax=Methanobacterium formicicum TaxID=2162 RepID=A0A090I4A4_METFO|nr:MAG: hypothetical protein XD90_1033 [Methanobacterium sp. 42_16]CEA14024.1 putative membrane protein [Methanobacterium formicicum]CEL24942.1 putative membrane protein [Methanobacterium formicicum]